MKVFIDTNVLLDVALNRKPCRSVTRHRKTHFGQQKKDVRLWRRFSQIEKIPAQEKRQLCKCWMHSLKRTDC